MKWFKKRKCRSIAIGGDSSRIIHSARPILRRRHRDINLKELWNEFFWIIVERSHVDPPELELSRKHLLDCKRQIFNGSHTSMFFIILFYSNLIRGHVFTLPETQKLNWFCFSNKRQSLHEKLANQIKIPNGFFYLDLNLKDIHLRSRLGQALRSSSLVNMTLKNGQLITSSF